MNRTRLLVALTSATAALALIVTPGFAAEPSAAPSLAGPVARAAGRVHSAGAGQRRPRGLRQERGRQRHPLGAPGVDATRLCGIPCSTACRGATWAALRLRLPLIDAPKSFENGYFSQAGGHRHGDRPDEHPDGLQPPEANNRRVTKKILTIDAPDGGEGPRAAGRDPAGPRHDQGATRSSSSTGSAATTSGSTSTARPTPSTPTPATTSGRAGLAGDDRVGRQLRPDLVLRPVGRARVLVRATGTSTTRPRRGRRRRLPDAADLGVRRQRQPQRSALGTTWATWCATSPSTCCSRRPRSTTR